MFIVAFFVGFFAGYDYGLSKSFIEPLPKISNFVFDDNINTPPFHLFDTLNFYVTIDSEFNSDSLLIVQSSSHKSLFFQNVGLEINDGENDVYLLKSIILNDTTPLKSGNVEVITFLRGSIDTLYTDFDLEI